MEFEIVTKDNVWNLPKSLIDDPDFPDDLIEYKKMKGLSIRLARKDSDEHDYSDFMKFCNCVRVFINGRTEVLYLTFDTNEECSGSEINIEMMGNIVPIETLRENLNTMIVKQVRGLLFELHLINDSPNQIQITSGDIKLKGGKEHNYFTKHYVFGVLDAGSEIHIHTMYMKSGRMFDSSISEFVDRKIKKAKDTTNASNNGLCSYRQPDMVGKSPLMDFPRVIEIDIPYQLYADPRDILGRALDTMLDDLKAIHKHELRSRSIIKSGNQYSYNDVSIKLDGEDLTCVLIGYIGMIGEVITSSAYSASDGTLTHFTSMWVHPTKKETLIRISGQVDAFAKGIELAMMRTKKLIENL